MNTWTRKSPFGKGPGGGEAGVKYPKPQSQMRTRDSWCLASGTKGIHSLSERALLICRLFGD